MRSQEGQASGRLPGLEAVDRAGLDPYGFLLHAAPGALDPLIGCLARDAVLVDYLAVVSELDCTTGAAPPTGIAGESPRASSVQTDTGFATSHRRYWARAGSIDGLGG